MFIVYLSLRRKILNGKAGVQTCQQEKLVSCTVCSNLIGQVFLRHFEISIFSLTTMIISPHCSAVWLTSQVPIKRFNDETSTVVQYSGIKLNCVKFESKMVLDFAVKNYKAKCKIKDQMENILIRRGYMALAVMIENASQYRVNIDCGVSFNLLIAICN